MASDGERPYSCREAQGEGRYNRASHGKIPMRFTIIGSIQPKARATAREISINFTITTHRKVVQYQELSNINKFHHRRAHTNGLGSFSSHADGCNEGCPRGMGWVGWEGGVPRSGFPMGGDIKMAT